MHKLSIHVKLFAVDEHFKMRSVIGVRGKRLNAVARFRANQD